MKFDFIEIGTSDFDTLAEQPSNLRGISVEPIPYYLDRLPVRENLTKVCAAIAPCEHPKSSTIFWVHPDDIEREKFPYWMRGCNRIGELHFQHLKPEVLKFVRYDRIQILSLKHLCQDHQVSGIGFLKIDTEGMDWEILLDFSKWPDAPWPSLIQFESNALSPADKVEEVKRAYQQLGYCAFKRHDDTLLVRNV